MRLSERAKVSLFPPQGEMTNFNNLNVTEKSVGWKDINLMDQDYVVVSGHVDETMCERIISGQYINFSKLLPKDRITNSDEKMELVVHDGKAFWAPLSEGVHINNFSKWEQAFRVYANVYAKGNPDRAGELIEYNHVIHSIASSYVWDNVYAYDRDFRMHLSRHPSRSWAIILQQAWSMRLRDHNNFPNRNTQETPNHSNYGTQGPGFWNKGGDNREKSSDYCKRFNKGKCNLGKSCRYEHRCSYWNKFGHGVIVCRKLVFDRDNKSGGSGKREYQSN